MRLLWRSMGLRCAAALYMTLLASGHAASAQTEAPAFVPMPAGVTVKILEPATGASVTSPVRIVFRLQGALLRPAGPPQPGAGHFHLLIDSPVVPAGQLIPSDANHLHFGKGQSEATIALAPGTHTLTLLLADGVHRSYGKAQSDTITLTILP